MKKKLPQARLRDLAVRASCDPRTINKAYNQEPIRGCVADRARAVLKEDGLLPLDARKP